MIVRAFPQVEAVQVGLTQGHWPHDLAVSDGDELAAGIPGLPGVVGHEWDVGPTQLGIPAVLPPSAPAIPGDPPAVAVLATAGGPSGAFWDYYGQDGASQNVRSEMVYWPRPNGGRVFYAGSVAFGWALNRDPSLSALFENVLHNFGIV